MPNAPVTLRAKGVRSGSTTNGIEGLRTRGAPLLERPNGHGRIREGQQPLANRPHICRGMAESRKHTTRLLGVDVLTGPAPPPRRHQLKGLSLRPDLWQSGCDTTVRNENSIAMVSPWVHSRAVSRIEG